MAVDLEMTLKDAQLLMGLLKQAREQEKVTKAVKGTQEAYKDAAKEIDRTVAATKALIATPAEKLTAKQNELNKALKAGKLTQDEVNRAMEVYKQKIIGVESATASVATKHKEAYGAEALGLVSQYTTATGLLTTTVTKLAEAYQLAAEKRKAAGESLKTDADHLVTLNQLSGSPEEFASRVKDFNKLRSEYGLSTEQASLLQETAISGGNEASMERFASTVGAGPAGERMKYATKLERLAGGQINEMQADAMIKAAADPSGVSPAELAKFTPSAGAMMQAQGASTAEVLGAMSVLSDTLKGPEAAADRLNNLQVAMALDPRFKGKGLIGGVEALQALSPEDRAEFMGKAEGLNIGYEQITQNRALIDQRIKAVDAAGAAVGTAGDPILASQRQFESSPEAQAIVRARIAEQKRIEAERGKFGVGALDLQSLSDAERVKEVQAGAGAVQAYGAEKGRQFANAAGASPEVSVGIGRGVGIAAEVLSPATSGIEAMIKLLEKIAGSNEKMANEPKSVPRGQGPAASVPTR